MTANRLISNLFVGLILLIVQSWAMAQQSGQSGSKGGGNTTPGKTTNLPKTGPQINAPRPSRQTIFITGTVVQEDGAPLPMGVVIERSCNNRVKRETTVDPAGHFSFRVGGDGPIVSDVLPDASDDDGMGNLGSFGNRRSMQPAPSGMGSSPSPSNLMGCEVRARLDGYRSSTVILQGFDAMGQIDVGTIVLYPIAKVPGTLVSATNLQAPKPAQKAMERAEKALHKKHIEEAEKQLKSAIELYPKYASAWFTLGQIYQQQQRLEDAHAAYQNAVTIDANYVSPYIQLAGLAGMEHKWQEVADITDHALSLDPIDFPIGYFLNSVANYNLGKLDAAERSARKAQRLDGLHRIPQVHLVMADILERKQDVTGSIEQLQAYLKFAPKAANADQIRSRLQDLQQTSSARVNK